VAVVGVGKSGLMGCDRNIGRTRALAVLQQLAKDFADLAGEQATDRAAHAIGVDEGAEGCNSIASPLVGQGSQTGAGGNTNDRRRHHVRVGRAGLVGVGAGRRNRQPHGWGARLDVGGASGDLPDAEHALRERGVVLALYLDMHQDPGITAISERDLDELIDALLPLAFMRRNLLQLGLEKPWRRDPVDVGVGVGETKRQKRLEVAFQGILPRAIKIGRRLVHATPFGG
jgi:hypothetical protein